MLDLSPCHDAYLREQHRNFIKIRTETCLPDISTSLNCLCLRGEDTMVPFLRPLAEGSWVGAVDVNGILCFMCWAGEYLYAAWKADR